MAEFCTLPNMAISGSEIRKAREAKGLSQEALGRAVGISQSAIRKIEAGDTVRSKFLPEIKQVLGLAPEPTLTPPSPALAQGPRLAVYAASEGGNGHMIVDFTPIDWLPRPQMFEDVPDAYAILISGESMIPAFEPGDHALVHPRLPPIRGTDVILYEINRSRGAKATIKRLAGFSDTEWTVQQWNPNHAFKLKRADWPTCHRVLGKFSRR